MPFEFATATKIVFGAGVIRAAGPAAKELGSYALLVSGRPEELADRLAVQVRTAGVSCTCWQIDGEPTLALVEQGVEKARAQNCDMVIGFGGGSSIDAGKAVAALLTNKGALLDYLEVVGKGRPLLRQSAPFIAIPTTAGTGSEVTRNAVLASPEHRVKASLRSPFMYPRLALADPELTYSLPRAITASTGMDALTQLIEPFVSVAASPLTDAICRDGIRRAGGALRRAIREPSDPAARLDMALASLFGGMALANARLGAVHGCAAVLGGLLSAPHGAICARLLPVIMDLNVRALAARAPGAEALARYAEIGRLTTGQDTGPDAAGMWARALAADLGIPPLAAHGLTHEMIPGVVREAQRASSTKGNPIALTDEELAAALEEAL